MKKVYFIDKNFINIRLDKWFKNNICYVPQSLLEKNIRTGKIKVNFKKRKSSYKLQLNDQVVVNNFNPLSKTKINLKTKYQPTKKEIFSTALTVIENNENFMVINKPAGISVQSGTKSKKNIVDILRKTNYFKKNSPFIVHRIDKDTTGLLIIAKNREYAQFFTTLFRIRKIHKTYLAIVIGEFDEPKGTFVDNLIYYEENKKINTRAITHFNVIDSNSYYSLLKLTPVTGRKHQLRKQLLLHKHPVLGDSKYKFDNVKKNKSNNLMLHAYKINFFKDNKRYEFVAEPSPIFKKMINQKYLKTF